MGRTQSLRGNFGLPNCRKLFTNSEYAEYLASIRVTRLLLEAGADLKYLDDKVTKNFEMMLTNLDKEEQQEADALFECIRQRRNQIQQDQVEQTPSSKRKDRAEGPDDLAMILTQVRLRC